MTNIKIEQQASFLKKEISNILKKEAKNILFQNITITDVKITKDNNYATIYWTMYLNNLDIKVVSNALEKAKGFCRTALAKISNKYQVPELRFKYDNSSTRVKNIEKILQNIKNNNSSNE